MLKKCPGTNICPKKSYKYCLKLKKKNNSKILNSVFQAQKSPGLAFQVFPTLLNNVCRLAIAANITSDHIFAEPGLVAAAPSCKPHAPTGAPPPACISLFNMMLKHCNDPFSLKMCMNYIFFPAK